MARVMRAVMGSPIAARLAALLLLPLAGLVLFGALAVDAEREAVHAARELRREAELIELLSSLAVEIDVEADALVGFREAGRFGVDVEMLADLVSENATTGHGDSDLDPLYDLVAEQDRSYWADAEAVDRLLAGRGDLDRYRAGRGVLDEGFRELRAELDAAGSAALAAQTDRLDQLFGQVHLGADLTSVARSMQPARSLVAAAMAERLAVSDYVLPIGDLAGDEAYEELVRANAAFDVRLTDLKGILPEHHLADLDALETTDAWESFSGLRDNVLSGSVEPIVDFDHPFEVLPAGIVIFAHGFERTHLLLDLDRHLSAEFTAGALQLEREANDRLASAVAIGLAVAIATIATSVVTIHSITKPVRSLLGRARQITGGDLETRRPSGGPTDISMVHKALDEMSANLRTLSDQAEALSAGRLDDAVLNRTVVGPIGASVHGSVARLRSMTARLEYEATHDALTGLPNRAAVLSLLDRCLTGPERERAPLAAIMLDLDGFKLANDDMGHTVGDEVLVHVAERLRRRANGEFVARLGGDEFMIVVAGADAGARAMPIARSAIEAIKAPTSVTGGTINISASAGVVETCGPSWLSPSEVLQRVDLALYQAKSDTPGETVLFDQRLHDSLLETTQLQGELRRALGAEEFELYLQPIVETGSRLTTGYEALLRWQSPLRGWISPGLFIPVAEQSELIAHIDNWVIERSAELLAGWQKDPATADLTLSINVSAKHLSRPELATRIEEVIERHRLQADRYVIEITESQLIPNLSRAEDTLRRLRSLGVQLAIDDFGTGYASVAHLRRVSFDRLKIDQSFLAHLDEETNRSLATLLVSLGRDLHLEVVAEGIETEEQLAWATSAGCTHAQGYLLGRPAEIVGPNLLPAKPSVMGRSARRD